VDISLTIADLVISSLLTADRPCLLKVATSCTRTDRILLKYSDPVRHLVDAFDQLTMLLKFALLSISLFSLTGAAPHSQKPLASVLPGTPRPVVIWHGLGDTSTGSGMAQFKKDLEEMYPGIFVMNVKVPAQGTLDDERKAGFVSRALWLGRKSHLNVSWSIRHVVGQCY
jgi:hypothetical protein